MIDIFSQVYTTFKTAIKTEFSSCDVKGEYVRIPAKFPCVTIEETKNVTPTSLYDSSERQKFATLRYRVRIFTNSDTKQNDARKIFAVADQTMWDLGFNRRFYSPRPEIYQGTLYEIEVTYECTVDENGTIYRKVRGLRNEYSD